MGGGRKITGVVFSDLGRAASFMALDWVQAALGECLGSVPYPGTLNVKLDTAEARGEWRAIRSERAGMALAAPDSAHCQARCFLVEIEGNCRGAVILPEVADYPADKVEVAAAVRLKDALGLADGRRVTLEFVEHF